MPTPLFSSHVKNSEGSVDTFRLETRPMRKNDLLEAQLIEQSCFEYAWTYEEMLEALQTCSCCCFVATLNGRLVGYIIGEMEPGFIHILSLGVHPKARFKGVGQALVRKVLDFQTSRPGIRKVYLIVRERNLDAQLFFRNLGFRAHAILRHYYQEMSEDAYLMGLKLDRMELTDSPSGMNYSVQPHLEATV